ncbi:phosphoribosylformylglycinamidine synthase subunit PurL [Trebonia sp.]|uniref:phosphoribosylformylglycinamidine synthase subunit PurL n=1 Tax=Trebonia sp. TaxID=2767075 RepID=UPI002631561E|nr:phosphoribosylformylglycinamidine synthase subunit PurL [Trebonia sp.]
MSGKDTIEVAAGTPGLAQPFAELGLTGDEYAKIRELLRRRPTAAELALYSVMWSEHCSYKSSKVHLRTLAPDESQSGALLAGIGANAGVVDIGQGYAVTFKIESHNHPSFVEPHQGAATGVGGIVRDILAMGARPVAVMDALRFGPADAHDTARVLPGVVSGISSYGNCLGLPNIGGELAFDPCYAGNPLVNALCVGVMRHRDLKAAVASGPGNKVILFGSRTGPDGVGGASVLASATFGGDGSSSAKRPSVQVGDPFMEKLLVECCLELYAAGLIEGIQDLGAAGVACATTELSAGGDGGMRVRLDDIPLRDPTLSPAEILMSESQERMMAVVTPANVKAFLGVCEKWDVEATVIGEVTGDGMLTMTWRGGTVVQIPPRTAADGPVYHRPMARPADLDALQAAGPEQLDRPEDGPALRAALLALLGSADLADKTWATAQYDRYVRGNTVLAMSADGGLLRVDEQGHLGIALATDGNGRYCRLDPYQGTQLALGEAYRNVAMTGARPVAVTNCLNFGSPEDPAVMWQFAEAVRGLADGCKTLAIPVTGGNVSLYNQTGGNAIHPTPVIGVLGVHEDVRRRLPAGFTADGARLVLLGSTKEEFGGSAWAHVLHAHLGGRPPAPDLASERALATLIATAAAAGVLASAHDLSDGGLAIALAESCLRGNIGCQVGLNGDPFTELFSESPARAIVSVCQGAEEEFANLCAEHGVPASVLGITGGDTLAVEGVFAVPTAELRSVWEATLPALFD